MWTLKSWYWLQMTFFKITTAFSLAQGKDLKREILQNNLNNNHKDLRK